MGSAVAKIEWFFLKEDVTVTVTIEHARKLHSGVLTGISQCSAYVETLATIPANEVATVAVCVPGQGGGVVHLRCTVAPSNLDTPDLYRFDFLREPRSALNGARLLRLLRERDLVERRSRS